MTAPMSALKAFLATALLIFSSAVFAASSQPRLIVVIDDLGDNLNQGMAAISLPGPVAYAVLPHTPYSVTLAELAHQQGKEVMLHVPMANLSNRRLGPGALTPDLNRDQLEAVLRDDIRSVPHVVGVNNHMGSLLTQKGKQMRWVMDILADQGLFFLDSVTTPRTTGWKTAYERGVPWLMRDVFLDHKQTTEFVDKQFRYGLKLAREQGFAVLIGHPYPVTVNYLQEALPGLGELGVQLVAPSGFLLQQSENRRLVDARRAEQRFGHPCDPDEGHCQSALVNTPQASRQRSDQL